MLCAVQHHSLWLACFSPCAQGGTTDQCNLAEQSLLNAATSPTSIIWGHKTDTPNVCEQESGSADTNFHVVQPGSSVATALSEGESRPKHVMVLEILKEAWRTVKHPLNTVRPFFFRSVSPF